MAKQNGFYRVVLQNTGAFIELVPPVDGGAMFTTNDVVEYLDKIKQNEYDVNALNQAVLSLSQKTLVKIGGEPLTVVHEQCKVRVSEDKMSAVIRLYPPSEGGKLFTMREFMTELEMVGVRYGIVDQVAKILVATPVFCTDVVVAKGQSTTEGADASIEYKFDTKPLAKPKMNEDGTVDFHQLDIFTRVLKDQLLAVLTPEVEGIEGMNVLGEKILPRKVKKAMLKGTKGVRISEDGLQMYSEMDGDVKLINGSVFVSDTYTVPADVDATTGDILYDGNVVVTGNVRTGFTVRAKGDIQVKGVVEGANIFSGGNIVLARGVQGMNRAILEAKGDVVSKFVESATVTAGGMVRAGSILHSQIVAGDKILCEGRKSVVIGGTLNAINCVDVKSLGNQMETVTNVKIGVDPSVLEELKNYEKEFAENMASMEKMTQVIMMFRKKIESGIKIPPDKVALIQQTSADLKATDQRQNVVKEEIMNRKEQIEANSRGYLRVSDTMFPGVRLTIGNCMYVVKSEQKYCRLAIKDNDIRVENY